MKLGIFNIFGVKKTGFQKQVSDDKTVKTSDMKNKSNELTSIPESYGRAQVVINSKNATNSKYTLKKFQKELNEILENTDRKYEFDELYKNLDKVDLEVASEHLKNLKIYLEGNSNYTKSIIKKGYFYSKEGAQAFSEMAKILNPKSKKGYVSELSTKLAFYAPESILALKKRDVLKYENIHNTDYMNKIANMSDEEYSKHLQDAEESIKKTGLSYEELLTKFRKEVEEFHTNDIALATFNKFCGYKGAIVAQYEMFNFLKDSSILDSNQIVGLLSKIDNDNLDDYKKIVKKLETYPEIDGYTAENILRKSYDEKVRSLLFKMFEIENMPLETINQELSDYYRAIQEKNENEIKRIEENIYNNSLTNAISEIKKIDFDLKINPTKLDTKNIKPSSLVLVHMTDYEPQDGKILSPKDKFNGSRNSVHFTLNHAVISHRNGDWDDKKMAIIMPYESTLKNNDDGKFIEGMPNDIYTNGSVKIPSGSIILKENKVLKNGEVKISNHPSIDGVKIIETSNKPHELVQTVIEKMGYTHCKADGVMGLFGATLKENKNLDNVCDNYDIWEEFCKSQGIKPNRHTGSIGYILESTIESIGALTSKNSWIFKEASGRKIDVKEHMLECLNYAKSLEEKGYFSYLDIAKFKEIVKEAQTPKEAIINLKKQLQISPTLKSKEFNSCTAILPLNVYQEWHNSSKKPEERREFLKKEIYYAYGK